MHNISDKKTLYKILRMYYIDNLTQNEISEKMGINRMRVARFIYYARDKKLIETKLNFPIGENDEMESVIERKYNLKECRIVNTFNDIESIYEYMAVELRAVLDRILEDGDYFGISWGATIAGVVKFIDSIDKKGVAVLPICGGVGIGVNYIHNTNYITKAIADKLGGVSYSINVPAMVDSKEAKMIMEKESTTRKIIEMTKKIKTILVSMSDLRLESTISNSHNLSKNDVQELKSLGIIGMVNMSLIDKNGNHINNKLDDRIINVFTLDMIKKTRNVIGVSFGEKKVEMIKACLNGKIINVLITDKNTSEKLLN